LAGGFENWRTTDPPVRDQQTGNFYFNVTTGQRRWFQMGLEPISGGGSGGGANTVTVTANGPKDGGNYGPNTPGTTTDGLQEALTHLRIREEGRY
jgi:hypothetical protein